MDEGKRGGEDGRGRGYDRSTAKFGRVDPEPGPYWPARSPSSFWDVLSEPGLREIRRILLAGINPRCPTSGSITTLLGETVLQHLILNVFLGQAVQNGPSLPACMQDKLNQGRAWRSQALN